MKHIATPTPIGVQPVSAVMPGNCMYPWCGMFFPSRAFTTDGTEMVVRACVASASVTGNMHVAHTTLYSRYGDRRLKAYDDDVNEYGEYPEPEPDVPRRQTSAGQRLLEEILNAVPTDTIYMSNVEAYAKRLDVHEVLIVKKAGGTAHRTRVNVWRRMP